MMIEVFEKTRLSSEKRGCSHSWLVVPRRLSAAQHILARVEEKANALRIDETLAGRTCSTARSLNPFW
jgi:hypothetical protein